MSCGDDRDFLHCAVPVRPCWGFTPGPSAHFFYGLSSDICEFSIPRNDANSVSPWKQLCKAMRVELSMIRRKIYDKPGSQRVEENTLIPPSSRMRR